MPVVRRSQRTRPTNSVPGTAKDSRRREARDIQSQSEGVQQTKRKAKPPTTYLHRSGAEIEEDPNRNLPLFSLPREIFDEIISHLPPSAEVCLTLCCKEGLHALGTASWAQFRGRSRFYYGSNGSLCELLQRDLPRFEYCIGCETIHPPIKPPHAHRTTKFTKLCLGQEATIDYWPQTPSGGYSLVFPHIQQAFQSEPTSSAPSPSTDLFNGDFTFQHGTIDYRLCSSARWIDRNFVITQEHRLRSSVAGSVFQAVDVTSLPFRVCAHLSTTTSLPTHSQRTARNLANGPLLTHAISTVFPTNLRCGVPAASAFRNVALSEQAQMTAGNNEPGFIWRCRSCPTKFRVEYHNRDGGELVVSAWHSFGRELYKALEYWKMFVRREGPTLGSSKRNSEYFVMTRSVPDFMIEQ
ncbi:hypothetical protein BDW59DRAFT_180339 [Aspergillus cavernicola]|uniref:F-box domain-containing protein n=1 Tax=Aspergillus cavernicola TaxID=176166 RepID=A0ABR4IBK6_9EURO